MHRHCTLSGLGSQAASEPRLGVSAQCLVLVDALAEFARRVSEGTQQVSDSQMRTRCALHKRLYFLVHTEMSQSMAGWRLDGRRL